MERNSELEQAMDACAERLEFLNRTFPLLATKTTLDGVLRWRNWRIQDFDHDSGGLTPPEQKTQIDVGAIAGNLLQQCSLEDVLELLLSNYSVELSISQLIDLIGKQEYLASLKRDVKELLRNAVSFEQIAALWNDLERPAFNGPVWNGRSISMLVG